MMVKREREKEAEEHFAVSNANLTKNDFWNDCAIKEVILNRHSSWDSNLKRFYFYIPCTSMSSLNLLN